MPGPAPGQTCSVCNSPAIALITNQMNQGVSDYKIAGTFSLRRNSVRNHRVNGHAGVKEAARTRGADLGAVTRDDPPADGAGPQAPEEFPAEGTPREQMDWLAGRLRSQIVEGEDIRPELARELRLSIEAQSKMGGGEPPPVVKVADVEGLRELFHAMHLALRPFPEARAALRDAWRRHRVEVDGDED